MNVKTFIDRPLLSIVISVMIVSLGLIAITTLPIEKYPDIAPPTINVWASYPGASAEAVQKSVIAPLEEAINGVENMNYMVSSAGNGNASITIYFAQGTNADMAAVNVQNRVASAQAMLPSEVVRIGVSTEKQQPGQLRTMGLESPGGTYDEAFLANYFLCNIKPAVQRIQGVGKVEFFSAAYALRIWLRPDAMAAHGVVPSDITRVLEEQNIEAGIGALGENSSGVYQYVLRYTGRRNQVKEYGDMLIRSTQSGEELYLRDVADIELGSSDYNFSNHINGHPGVIGMVSQTSGSNATRINLEIDALLEDLQQQLPPDVRIVTFDNTNDFLFASIREVVVTLIIAILLVLVVVYFFLQDLRATLIPAAGIVVSLIGTFAFMYVAGFSINLLTLFALVLVIGTVVDNSIVVVEAVQARFDAGYTNPVSATHDAMKGLTTALFTTTLVFMVIFLPVSFTGGTTGIFYKQFGLTMAVAVGISFVNAITLSSALCALLLRPAGEGQSSLSARVRKAYQASHEALMARYTGWALFFIRRKWLVALCLTLAIVLAGAMMYIVPTGFVPDEDNGAINVEITTPSGYTQYKTEQVLTRVSERLERIDGVQDIGAVVGFSFSGSGSNHAMAFIQLKPWGERRGITQAAVLDEVNAVLAEEKEAECFASAPGMIDGYGNGGGFEFSLQDQTGADIETFFEVSEQYLARLNERPEIADAFSGYDIHYPQYVVEVDASRCKRMGVSPSDVLGELGAYMGSAYISNMNLYNKVYQVTMQLRAEDRERIEQLDAICVRSDDGRMLPIGQFIRLEKEYRPQTISRFNMMSSIAVSGNVASGYSSGQAIRAIREVAGESLPRGYRVEFSGITREQSRTSNNMIRILLVSLFFMYLVMVALYESLFIPLAILLSVPFGLCGALLMAQVCGVENNIYLQIGFIMLIGLLCKTAILLTEYATQCRKAGMSLKQSAFFSAKMRLRPILMTSLTMVFGMLPMLFASGAGANGSRTIGAGAVGGMLLGTLGLLVITPALFVVFQTIQERFRPVVYVPSDDPLIAEEMQRIEEYTRKKNEKKTT